MEVNLASRLSGNYKGNLIYTSSRKVGHAEVLVERLNHIVVKVHFYLNGVHYSFRGVLSEQEEGLLMIVEDKVTYDYVLKGVNGFVYQKPNVHGGFIDNLDSFYFHIAIRYFSGPEHEVYFMGKTDDLFDKRELERKVVYTAMNGLRP